MRTRRAGFTLVEIMVAVILAALTTLGLASIFSTSLKTQVHGYKKDVVQGDALISLKALTRDVQATTYLDEPLPPCPLGDCTASSAQGSDRLRGCTNYDPARGGIGLLDSSFSTMRVYQYCVDGSGTMFYTWRDGALGAVLPCPPAAVACGTAIPGGELMQLAQKVGRDDCPACGAFFRRPAYLNNVVELHYVVGSSSPTQTINAAVGALKTYHSVTP